MTKTYKGLDCIKDLNDPLYAIYQAQSQQEQAWADNMKYAFYCMYFATVLVFVLMFKNLYFKFLDISRTTSSRDTSTGGGISTRVIYKITALSRFFAYKRIQVLISRVFGLPSSFGALFVIFASTLFVLCYTFIPHFWYRGCSGFGAPPLAVRSGLMTMGLLPFLMSISGKTNFISFLTGISYERLNVYHQLLGWFTLFLSLVHAIPFLVQSTAEGGIANLRHLFFTDMQYYSGVPTLVLIFLICVTSTHTFRDRYYEIFANAHWVMGMGYIATLTWHVYQQMNSERFVWGTLAFWVVQLVYRALIKTTFKPNSYAFKTKKAAIKLLDSGIYEVVINVNNAKGEFSWMAGQHILIRFVQGLHTLDNHPFSILTMPKLSSSKSQLRLLIKPYKGLTAKIYDMIKEKGETSFQCYIDGPYGGLTRDHLSFDKLFLVSSGTGITATFGFLDDVVNQRQNGYNLLKKVEMIWIVREIETLNWVKKELMKILEKFDTVEELRDFVDIKLFVTNSSKGATPVISTACESNKKEQNSTAFSSNLKEKLDIDFHQGLEITEDSLFDFVTIFDSQKPDLSKYIHTLNLKSKNCFIVSGTASLQVDCGLAVSELQKKVLERNSQIDEVYLHTENFGW